MDDLWKRLEQWFATHTPQASLKLRPPADEVAIARAESRLGIAFPQDFRASLLVHDGQEDEPDVFAFPGIHRLGSLDSLVRCWEGDRQYYDDDPQRFDWLDRSGRVRQVHLHPRQIPIGGSTYWDYDRLLYDFVPAAQGREGQLILRQDVELIYLCESFRVLMQKTVDGLERGTIVTSAVPFEIGGGLELQYLSPRAKKPISCVRYFAD